MSKLSCECGNTISDSTDNIPYKARFIRDEDYHLKDKTLIDICSFIEAYKNGEKENWIRNYFGNDADVNIRNEWILIHIEMKNELNIEDVIYQCEECGRIKIETRNENNFASFIPENGNWKDILNGKLNSVTENKK